MGMDIDETWRDDHSAGIGYLVGAGCGKVADLGNLPAGDADIPLVPGGAAAIDNGPILDDVIVRVHG
jgi:hypothetical protein